MKKKGKRGPAIIVPQPRMYLAYGSNLRVKSMKQRCPDARPVGKMLLDNAKLVFRGVADLIYEPGHLAPAGLWEISARDEEKLDQFEGVSSGMYDKFRVKLNSGGSALLYLMRDKGIFPPSAWYAGIIRDGYRNFGLEECFLDEAIRHAYDQKEHSDQTRNRRSRQRLQGYQNRLVKIPEALALERLDKQGSGA